jgi:TonB-dependent starch-binding outer membrane protein SusC
MISKSTKRIRDLFFTYPFTSCFTHCKFLLLIAILFLHISTATAQGNKHRVTGRTISSTDEKPLPGVNIVIKGTSNGTVSDIEGNYSIDANDADILVFSYIGHNNEEVTVGAKTIINISLTEDIAKLGEVVVVGYGQMKRTDISGAQTSIKSEDIQKTVNTTIDQAIQGRAAGVYVTQNSGQPGGGISVNIRGVNSLNGSNEPLYVIDGVQIAPGNVSYGSTSSTNPLASLNPNDIESMEILQGPSATAIYGSRGTNGVVLVTTKRGKSGEMKANYTFLYSVQDKPKKLPVMNLREYAQMTNEIRAIAGGNPPSEFQDPSVLGEGTNWQDALFKTSPLFKHQLSLSGGSEKTTFYLGGEYFTQEGVAQGSEFDRYGVRLNVDNQTRKWLKLGMNLNLTQTNDKLSATSENTILNALQLAPNIPVKNPNGTWGGADANNGNSVQYTPLNPVAIANLIDNTYKRRQALGGFNVDINLIKGLTFRTTLNGNVGYNSSHLFTPTWRLGDKTNDQASLSDSKSESVYWNWNQLLQYNLKLGLHDIGLMASHEAQKSTWSNLSGNRTGFVTNEIPDLNIGSTQGQSTGGGKSQWGMESYLGRANYSYNNKYIVQATGRFDGSANFGPNNKWGFFPSLSAAWRVSQENFMQNISFLEEFKIRFETGLTGNQGGYSYYGPLRSVSTPWGAGFILSRFGNESMKWEQTKTNNIGFNLSILKNRVQLEGDFYIKKTKNLLMLIPLPDYFGTSAEGAISPPNVNIGELENRGYGITLTTVNLDRGGLKWTSNFNISGFKTKITKFYTESSFLDRSAWYLNGWTQRAILNESPWLFRGYIEEGIFQSVEELNNSALPVDSEGKELVPSASTVWVGDVKYKDINGDGLIDERDQTNIGNPWPKFSFGFTNSVSYKGFDFSILLTGSYGNDVFNYLRFINTNPGNINLGRNLLKETFQYARVATDADGNPYLENPDTHVPRIVGNDVNGNGARFTQKYVEDGSYIRVKNIALGYSLPAKLIGNQKVIKGARVGISIQNLKTFTKYKGYDPEVGAYVGRDVAADNQSIGLDYGRYPLTPVYSFNIGVDF